MAAHDSSNPTAPIDDSVWLTPASLRVLAHPLRSRLLGALRAARPLDGHRPRERCSARTPGATSYHLRKLESVGLVQDTEEGEGKRRLWRASSEYHSWHPSDFEGDEDSETALNWLTRDYARHFSEQYDQWLDVSTTWPTAWQDACGSSDAAVLVTAESLEAMREEMWDAHRALPPGRTGQPAGPADRGLRLRLPPRPRPPAGRASRESSR